jgi:hypothetical protein
MKENYKEKTQSNKKPTYKRKLNRKKLQKIKAFPKST